ncbi:MAG: hypothetical protein AAB875_06355, partial [Patescibacteria group bacterium]
MNNYLAKLKVFLSSKSGTIALSFLGLYLLSSGVSLAIFSFLREGEELTPGDIEQSRSRINLNLPKTEECPLNGGKFTKIERDIWESHRPITAMI